MAVHTFAAIDVGSFELELGIYEITVKYGIREIDHVRHVIALGKDTYNDEKISHELVEEMCRVLENFTEIMKSYRVDDYRAYATSAMREAKNNQIVVDQIKVKTGINIRIISNSEQRFISYKAIASKEAEFNKIIQKGTAIVDVGFGSIQVSLFDKDSLVSTQNLRLGVLRIHHMLSHMKSREDVNSRLVEELVDNELYTFKKMYLKDRDIKNLIGVGECILYLSRQTEDGRLSDRISKEQFSDFYNKLLCLNLEEVQEKFGVSAEHAALLVPSAIIYKRVLEMTGAEMFWVPGIRMCDGIVAAYAEKNRELKFHHDFEEDILMAARNMAKRYKCHNGHIQVLEKYVLTIFDSMKRYHGLGTRERLLLQISAILHACGKFISMKNTSECAYNIIMSTEIIGLSDLDREIIANVVKYNIQPFDYNEVRFQAGIFREARAEMPSRDVTILIAKLTAILRLANSMDRGHQQKLKDCKLVVKENILVISTTYEGDITLEEISFDHKADFFEELFGIRPVLKQKRRI